MKDMVGFIIVLVFIVVFSVLRKAAEALARQQRAARPADKTIYEAMPERVREFIEQVRGARPPEEAAEPLPIAEAEPVEAPEPLLVLEAEPVEAAPLALPAEPVAKPAPRRRRKRAATPAREPAPRPPSAAAREAALGPAHPVGFDLRQAIVWLEILGPPLCLRRRTVHWPRTSVR